MKNKKITTREAVEQALLAFASGARTPDDMLTQLGLPPNKWEDVSRIMTTFNCDWDNAPCDCEGPTKEQDANLDSILENSANELLALTTDRGSCGRKF